MPRSPGCRRWWGRRWQLFHTDEDRSEAHDLADQHPEKLEELKALWFEEAKANNVLPLNDMDIIGNPQDLETFMGLEFNAPVPPGGQYTSRFGSHALIVKVVFDDAYIDVERHFAAAMARD
jgi:hypothetical protein